MRKSQNQPAQGGAGRKRPAVGLLALCLTLVVGIVVSLAFLGSRIALFSREDDNVIPIFPPEEALVNAGDVPAPTQAATKPAEPAPSTQAAPQQTLGTTSYAPAQPSRVELLVYDDLQVWSSETQASLFRSGYNDTVQSGNGDKIIAPGTSNFYDFSVKNNGNVTMDYSVSLKVDTYLGADGDYSQLPIEWRLLSGDGAVLSDWQNYNERTETLKSATLAVRNQERYTIEWRWLFERGEGMDEADTEMGNWAEDQPIGVNATIYIYAEQTDPNEVPKTGDDFCPALYLLPMAAALCGLALLSVLKKRKNCQISL